MNQPPEIAKNNADESGRSDVSDMEATKPYAFDSDVFNSAAIDDGTSPLPVPLSPHDDGAVLDKTGDSWPDKPI